MEGKLGGFLCQTHGGWLILVAVGLPGGHSLFRGGEGERGSEVKNLAGVSVLEGLEC